MTTLAYIHFICNSEYGHTAFLLAYVCVCASVNWQEVRWKAWGWCRLLDGLVSDASHAFRLFPFSEEWCTFPSGDSISRTIFAFVFSKSQAIARKRAEQRLRASTIVFVCEQRANAKDWKLRYVVCRETTRLKLASWVKETRRKESVSVREEGGEVE